MATRTIENKRDRLATILVTPFMTCSARLPVYMLLIAAFIPNIAFAGRVDRAEGNRDAGPVPDRFSGGVGNGSAAEEFDFEVQRNAIHPGIAAVSDANVEVADVAAGRSGRSVPQAGGDSNLIVHAWPVGTGECAGASSGHPPELEQSVIGRLGHFIEPAIAPLGFNWKIGIGLLSSVLAREVMVGTMGTLYGADPETQSLTLQTALAS